MNTMVRLGAGTTDPTNIEPLSIVPSVLELPSDDDVWHFIHYLAGAEKNA